MIQDDSVYGNDMCLLQRKVHNATILAPNQESRIKNQGMQSVLDILKVF